MGKHFEEDRLIIILKYIQNNQCITLNETAKYLEVSTKTIKNDIKLLNELLEKHAFIEGEQGSYRLYIINKDAFDVIKKNLYQVNRNLDTPKKRMAFLFKRLASSNTPLFIEDLAFDMNIGRSTIIGDIKHLNEELKAYSLCIKGKANQGIKLIGAELNIRYFILEHIYSIFFLDKDNNRILNHIMEYVCKQYHLEYVTQIAFQKNLTLLLDRVEHGHTLNEFSDKYDLIEHHEIFSMIQFISKELESLFDISLSREECVFMAIPLITMRTPTNIESIGKIQISNEIRILIQNICNQIQEDLNIAFSYQHIKEEFFYHITFMINRLQFGYSFKNPIAKEMKERYQLAYNMASIASRVISEVYGVFVPEDEIAYITAYFGAYILENKITHRIYNVAIVCSVGRGTAILILSHLKLIFDQSTQYQLFSDNQISVEILEEFDIVFTNFKLDMNLKIPVIKIKDLFDEKEIKMKIEKELQLFKYQSDQTKKRTEICSVIASLIHIDKIFILNHQKDYIENLSDMIDSLYHLQYVDKDFKNRILYREEKAIMIFDTFVAFPHTINKQNNEVMISIGISNEGIQVREKEEYQIKIFFLLGLPEEIQNNGLLLRIYDEIISIAHNKVFLDMIASSQNTEEVMKHFIKWDIKNH